MRSALGANEIFSPQKFLGDLVAGLANRGHPMFPSKDFHQVLEFAVGRDLERFMNARNRELDAIDVALHRHEVVGTWTLGSSTATARRPPRADEMFWDARSPRPDESDGLGQSYRFRKQLPLDLNRQKAAHMREVTRQRRAEAAGASGSAR